MAEELVKRRTSYLNDRYAFTKKHIDDSVSHGRVRYGRWRPPEVSMDSSTRYVVTAKDIGRLDVLAWRFLGDVRLWPVIAYVNSIRNQLADMYVDQEIKIPLASSVQAITERLH